MLLRGFTGPDVVTQNRQMLWRINGVLQSTTNLSLVTSVSESKCLGTDIDNFHWKKRQGLLLPMTAFYKGSSECKAPLTGTYSATKVISGKTHSYTSDNYSWNSASSGYGYLLDANTVWGMIGTEFDVPGLVQKAAASIYQKGWDCLTFIGELKDTISMFASLLERFIRVLRKQPTKGSPYSAWLEWRYGWRTLLMDIENFVEVTTSFDETKERYRKASKDKTTKVDQSYNVSNDGRLEVTQILRTELTYEVVGRVIAEIIPPRFACNPLTTSWELVKLSFVIDWFIGVGQSLCAMSFLFLQKHYYSSVGALLTIKATRQLSVKGINGWTGSISQPSWISSATYKVREPVPVPLLPRIWIKLDVSKILDLLSLLTQLLAKKKVIKPGFRLPN